MATFSQRIGANDNDSYSVDSSNYSEYFCYFGYDGAIYASWFRYTNVTIPKGSTINSATIDVVANGNKGASGATIYCVSSDDTSVWSSVNNPNEATRTTASTAWSVPSFVSGTSYTTPDFKAVIQEIVNRTGWSSGNDLSVLIVGTNALATLKRVYDYSEDVTKAAIITIDYTEVSSNTSNFFQMF